jgi:hypothetical protein
VRFGLQRGAWIRRAGLLPGRGRRDVARFRGRDIRPASSDWRLACAASQPGIDLAEFVEGPASGGIEAAAIAVGEAVIGTSALAPLAEASGRTIMAVS